MFIHVCFSLMRWFNIIIIFKEFQIFSHFWHHLSFSLVVPLTCPMFLWSINIKVVIANVYFYQLLRATVVWNNILLVIFHHAQSNLVETWFILNEHFLIFNQLNTKIDEGWFWYSKFIINDLLQHCWKRSRISCLIGFLQYYKN